MVKALVIVDLQNDFMPGGPLAVEKGDEIIPVVNRMIPLFPLVVATQDWHPAGHKSFAVHHPGMRAGEEVEVEGVRQKLWGVHCVRNTPGAKLVDGLDTERIECCFYKGTDPLIDSYSAFFDNAHRKSTGLGDYLKSRGVDEVYVAGVATDYCVLYSVRDALELGFHVYVVIDACRGIELHPGDTERALQEMQSRGARLTSSAALLPYTIL